MLRGKFETATNGTYKWLNDVVGVGVLRRNGTSAVIIEMWHVSVLRPLSTYLPIMKLPTQCCDAAAVLTGIGNAGELEQRACGEVLDPPNSFLGGSWY